MDHKGVLMSGDRAVARIRGGEIEPLDMERLPLYLHRPSPYQLADLEEGPSPA